MPGRMVVGPPRVSLSSRVAQERPRFTVAFQKLRSSTLAMDWTPSPCDSPPKFQVHHFANQTCRLRVRPSGVSLRNCTRPCPPPRSVWVAKPASLGSNPGLIPQTPALTVTLPLFLFRPRLPLQPEREVAVGSRWTWGASGRW